MTPSQYWDEDVDLAKAYRAADEIKQKRLEQELWLENLYAYHAMVRVAPAFNSLRPREPVPYLDKPLSQLLEEQKQEAHDETKTDEERMQPGLQHFISMAMAHNKRIKKGGDDENGRGDSGPSNKAVG